jgi:hypothetical protein
MLIGWRRQEDFTVAVPLCACDIPLSEQRDAFIGLRTKVGHISSANDYIYLFFFQPIEGCSQPDQATVGITDNADSHFKNLSP